MNEQHMLRLIEALENKGIDALITTHNADIRWQTGFADVFDEEQAHLTLLICESAHESACLFTDMRYSEAFRSLDKQGYWRVFDERRRRFPHVAEVLAESLSADLRTQAQSKPLVIGIESDLRLDWYRALDTSLGELKGFTYELRELKDLIVGLRAKKTTKEIQLIKQTQAITDAAYGHMLDYLKPGQTEREVAAELEFFMKRSGASGLSFPSIVASGPNSAIPHFVPSDRVLQHGDIVLMDFGARLNDYCTDMTRTVILGEANEQQRDMYAATLAAQKAVIAALKPGLQGLEVQKIAEDSIAEHGFEGKLIHSVGHGVGIEIHELPVAAREITDRLEPGHVITVEPGVYLEGVGGVRIEDFGVITKDGFENFTNSPTDLIIL